LIYGIIDSMNLRGTDLNLLVILDALLDEAHVSRAAERVGLSQPATSQALERCRILFRDELLIRGYGNMRRTQKAEALRAPLKSLLASTTKLIAPAEVDLATMQRRIRIIMADQPASVVVAQLYQRLLQSAPGIDLIIRPWGGASNALAELASGTSDIAVSVFGLLDPAFVRVELLRENYMVLMRKDHPAANDVTLNNWLAHSHIVVSARADNFSPIDEALARLGRSRRVAMVVPSFLMVPPLVAGSDLVAMLPSRCLPSDVTCFSIAPPPIAIDGFALHMAWHRRSEADPVIRHVAAQIAAAFA
jgi:DNA-binding transcriptional LysR family regulator